MSAVVFSLRQAPRQRVDLAPLAPERLAGRTPGELAAIALVCGGRAVPAGELFDIEGGDAAELCIRGACDKLDRIGQGMRGGLIRVEGDAGAYLGADMTGGTIALSGRAGDYAASGMRGGLLRVAGGVGDYLAAALPGGAGSMNGGTVWVGGGAGARAGERMRRGTVIVEGDAGDYCACRMLAGTLAVAGRVGEHAGYGMQRGSLILFEPPARMLPGFNDCGAHELGFLRLLFASWRALPTRFAGLQGARAARHVGDLGNGGKGEILVLGGQSVGRRGREEKRGRGGVRA